MKNILITLLCGSALTAPLAQAQTIVDNFLTGGSDYGLAKIQGQNPTVTGFSGAWYSANTDATGPSISSTNLSFSNSSGTVATAGGSVFIGSGLGVAGRVNRNLATPIGLDSDTTVYISLMMQNSLTSNTSQYRAFELNRASIDNNDDSNRILQLGLSNGDFGTTNYGFRINNNNSLRGNFGISNTNTNFFVIKLTLSSTALSDSITVWANPTNLSSETLSGSGVGFSGLTLSNTGNSIGRIQFAGFTAGTTNFDAVRIGDSWQAVTTIPEPSTWALIAISLTALTILRRRRARA
jgi:hypothetical protein